MTPITIPIAEMNSIDLPPVCVGTGAQNEVKFHKVKFAWYPRWVAALILVPYGGLLLAAVVAAILTKRAKGELPFSDLGWSRWRQAKLFIGLSVVVLFAGIIGGIGLMIAEIVEVGLLAFALGLIVPLAIYFAFKSHGPQVLKITDSEITLKIPSAEAAQAIHGHLHAGQGARVARAV
jgi:hypothetical protein